MKSANLRVGLAPTFPDRVVGVTVDLVAGVLLL